MGKIRKTAPRVQRIEMRYQLHDLPDSLRHDNYKTWPDPKYLQLLFNRYSHMYDFNTFGKEILPNIYDYIFKIIFRGGSYCSKYDDEKVFAVFVLNGQKIREEVTSPILLRKFSDVFYPYINKEIDGIFRFFGVSYDEYAEKYRQAMDPDRNLSNIVAFVFFRWNALWDPNNRNKVVGYEKIKYHCDMETEEISRH